jgi:hypothetical protein
LLKSEAFSKFFFYGYVQNWIGHILLRNWLQKIGGKVEERVKVTGRRRRRRKLLLDHLKETRGYCKLKEEALDGTVWRTGFGRGYGTDIRLWN